jgi:hypothetical protein
VLATHADKVEADAEDDSVAHITSPEVRRLNGGWATMEIEAVGKTVKEAAAKEKASGYKEGFEGQGSERGTFERGSWQEKDTERTESSNKG